MDLIFLSAMEWEESRGVLSTPGILSPIPRGSGLTYASDSCTSSLICVQSIYICVNIASRDQNRAGQSSIAYASIDGAFAARESVPGPYRFTAKTLLIDL